MGTEMLCLGTTRVMHTVFRGRERRTCDKGRPTLH